VIWVSIHPVTRPARAERELSSRELND